MTKYLITFKPITPFFFGGENTFGEGTEVNFFARSNYLPQQTTLLGFLRYELLQQNNLIGSNPSENNWNQLIGPASFLMQNGHFTSDFGAIKNLSPVFLSNGTEHFICQSLDWGIDEIENKEGLKEEKLFPLEYSLSSFDGEINTGNTTARIPALKAGSADFSQKNGIKSLWVSSDGKKMCQWDHFSEFKTGKGYDNGFFIEEAQPGIYRRTQRTKQDTGDFYKQISYRLHNDFAFAFFADIELPSGKKFAPRIVTMGGERSVFEMKVKPVAVAFEELFTPQTFNENRKDKRKVVILTSDAYATDDLRSCFDFAIIDTTPFRNITTAQQQNGNYARIRGGVLLKTQKLIYLLKRGSIFYTSNTDKLKQALTNTAFHKIGYNHFIEL
jgi:CRISPR-associated protein Cmr3